jgi:hypothetical protein
MVTDRELPEPPEHTPLDFCLCCCMKSEVYERKGDTRNELLTSILDAAASIKKPEDQLRRTTRDLRTSCMQNALMLTVGISNIYCQP